MNITRRSILKAFGIGSAVVVSGVSLLFGGTKPEPVLRKIFAGKGITINTTDSTITIDYKKGDIIQASDGHLYKAIGTS